MGAFKRVATQIAMEAIINTVKNITIEKTAFGWQINVRTVSDTIVKDKRE